MPQNGTPFIKRLWLTNAMFGVSIFANSIGILIVDYYFGADPQVKLQNSSSH